ncbi:hypothetical protein B0H13DRAFT_1892385 [Mycena leptocephala]|nr:hypothetical protein B0H13DRAFT_1892385 [Mycena leptocephala]
MFPSPVIDLAGPKRQPEIPAASRPKKHSLPTIKPPNFNAPTPPDTKRWENYKPIPGKGKAVSIEGLLTGVERNDDQTVEYFIVDPEKVTFHEQAPIAPKAEESPTKLVNTGTPARLKFTGFFGSQGTDATSGEPSLKKRKTADRATKNPKIKVKGHLQEASDHPDHNINLFDHPTLSTASAGSGNRPMTPRFGFSVPILIFPDFSGFNLSLKQVILPLYQMSIPPEMRIGGFVILVPGFRPKTDAMHKFSKLLPRV